MGTGKQTLKLNSPSLSIVIPVYNGATTIGHLIESLCELDIDGGLEIILVVDGSPDNSLQICQDLCQQYSTPIQVMNLSRNFGEHNAVMAGLKAATGQYIINMDDDLQNPVEDIVRLWQHTRDGGFDVCYTHYPKKQDASWRNWGSQLTNWCADKLLDKPKGLYLSSFRCMNQFTSNSICQHAGPYPYIDGLILQVTQNISTIEVSHLKRESGVSNYTLRRLLRLFLSMFLNFSVVPLRVTTLAGVVIGAAGFIGMLSIIIEALLGSPPRGWSSLMAGILFLAGTQLIMLGIIGEYLGRLFLTSNQKPQYVVRDVYSNQQDTSNE